MDEARRRAEEVADEVARWQSRQHIIEILLVYAADAVAQAVKEHECVDYCWEPDHTTETGERERRVLCVQCSDARAQQQAKAIARLTTDLVGAEATNALLDEEIARLRAEIERWKDTLEMELTHSQAWVAQAVRAERERCSRLTCRYCADGWEVDSEGLHTIPKSGFVTPGHLCRAEALRAPSIEEVSGSVDPDNLPDLRARDD